MNRQEIKNQIENIQGRIKTLQQLQQSAPQEQTRVTDQVIQELESIMEGLLLEDEELLRQSTQHDAMFTSEKRMRSVFSRVRSGIALIDAQGMIIEVNPALREILNCTTNELAGESFVALLPPGDTLNAIKILEQVIDGTHDEYQYETYYRCNDGRTSQLMITIASLQTPQYAVAFIENISQQKAAANKLEEMRQRLIVGGEVERSQLARHLHDGPLQDLYAVFYQVNLILADLEPGTTRDKLRETQQMLQHILNDLRMTTYELRPPALSHYGLGKAILSYAERYKAQHSWLQVHLKTSRDDNRLPEDARMVLFHNFQQLMINITQHSQAQNVWVVLEIGNDYARLVVSDDGTGFHVPEHWIDLARDQRLGLAGCAERAAALGGTFSVQSDETGGSSATTSIPIPPRPSRRATENI